MTSAGALGWQQLAAECVRRGLVKASHDGEWHSVSIHEKGRQLARKAAGLAPSR